MSNSTFRDNCVFTSVAAGLLMYLFMPILEDGRKPRQQVLDWRSHLGHSNDIHNGLEGAQNGTQHFWVLLS